jgi:hypothetical protein
MIAAASAFAILCGALDPETHDTDTALRWPMPRSELRLSFGLTANEPARLEHVSGPINDIRVPFRLYPRFQGSYAHWLDRQYFLSLSFGLAATPTSYTVGVPSATDSTGEVVLSEGKYALYGHILDRLEVSGLLHRQIGALSHWTFDFGAGLRATLLPDSYVSIAATDGDLGSQYFISVDGEYDGRAYLGGVFRVGGGYLLKNLNRLTFDLEAYYQPAILYWGDYFIAPGTSAESEGRFELTGSYVCMSVGYAFTWGPPKQPRWMRKIREQAAPVE